MSSSFCCHFRCDSAFLPPPLIPVPCFPPPLSFPILTLGSCFSYTLICYPLVPPPHSSPLRYRPFACFLGVSFFFPFFFLTPFVVATGQCYGFVPAIFLDGALPAIHLPHLTLQMQQPLFAPASPPLRSGFTAPERDLVVLRDFYLDPSPRMNVFPQQLLSPLPLEHLPFSPICHFVLVVIMRSYSFYVLSGTAGSAVRFLPFSRFPPSSLSKSSLSAHRNRTPNQGPRKEG